MKGQSSNMLLLSVNRTHHVGREVLLLEVGPDFTELYTGCGCGLLVFCGRGLLADWEAVDVR